MALPSKRGFEQMMRKILNETEHAEGKFHTTGNKWILTVTIGVNLEGLMQEWQSINRNNLQPNVLNFLNAAREFTKECNDSLFDLCTIALNEISNNQTRYHNMKKMDKIFSVLTAVSLAECAMWFAKFRKCSDPTTRFFVESCATECDPQTRRNINHYLERMQTIENFLQEDLKIFENLERKF